MTANHPQTFTASLERLPGGLGWIIARVPFVPSATWPNMIRLRVRGQAAAAGKAHAFRSSLFPGTEGGFFLLTNRSMLHAIGAHVGDSISILLEPDLEPRSADLPDEFAVLLDEEPGLRAWYDNLSEYTRRELGKWITGVKSDGARLHRSQQAAERLLNTMEAEVELPPLLASAFRRNPKAFSGWQQMTAAQRRGELMAVFYYQTAEARSRRLQKVIDSAAKRAAPKAKHTGTAEKRVPRAGKRTP